MPKPLSTDPYAIDPDVSIAQQAAEKFGWIPAAEEVEEAQAPDLTRLRNYVQRLREQQVPETEIRKLLGTPELRRAAATYLGYGQEQAGAELTPEYRAAEKREAELGPPITKTPGGTSYPLGGQPAQPSGTASASGAAGGGYRVSGARGGRTRGAEYLTGVTARAGEARGLITSAAQSAEAATRSIKQQQGLDAEATAGIMTDTEVDIVEGRRVHRERADAIQKNKQVYFDKVTDIQQRMSETTVDPERYFKDGGNLWGALAVALGAVGQAVQRTAGDTDARNEGVDAMMKAIDNDMQAQAMEIEKMGMEAAMADNTLARFQAELGDERAAWAATKMGLLQQALRKIDIVRQQGIAAVSEDSADLAVAGLRQAQARTLADLNKSIDTASANKYNNEEAMRRTQATIAASERARLQASGALAGPARSPIPGTELYDPSLPAVKGTDLSAMRKFMSQTPTVRHLYSKLLAYRASEGASNFVNLGEELNRAVTNSYDLIVELKLAKQMGAHFTEMEKMLLGIRDNPAEFGYYLAQLQEKAMNFDFSVNSTLKAYNLRESVPVRTAPQGM